MVYLSMPSGALQLLGLLVSHALQRPSMSIGPRSTPNGTYRPRFGVRVRITADMFPSSRPHSVSRFRLPSHSCRPSAVTLFALSTLCLRSVYPRVLADTSYAFQCRRHSVTSPPCSGLNLSTSGASECFHSTCLVCLPIPSGTLQLHTRVR